MIVDVSDKDFEDPARVYIITFLSCNKFVVFRKMTKKPICRDAQIAQLCLYLGLGEEEDPGEDELTLPELLLVQGVEGTGKTLALQWLLSHYFVNHASVDCIECYQPKLIFQV